MSLSGDLGDFDLDLALEGLAIRGDPLEMECVIKCLGEQIKKTKERYARFNNKTYGLKESYFSCNYLTN